MITIEFVEYRHGRRHRSHFVKTDSVVTAEIVKQMIGSHPKRFRDMTESSAPNLEGYAGEGHPVDNRS